MIVQAKPSVGGAQRLLPFERIALVLQGGGALAPMLRQRYPEHLRQIRDLSGDRHPKLWRRATAVSEINRLKGNPGYSRRRKRAWDNAGITNSEAAPMHRKPYDPATSGPQAQVHDCRAKSVNRGLAEHLVATEIEDPFATGL